MSDFKFDPETDTLVATRDFQHGVVIGKKGEAVDVSALPVASIRGLVKVANVVKVEKAKTKDKAGNGGSSTEA